VQVKICGLTRPTDAERAVELGATHLGCVLVEGTPRAVTPEVAREVLRGRGAQAVLVLRDPTIEECLAKVDAARIPCVQLHDYREEVAAALESAGVRVHRVLDAGAREAPRCAALLATGSGPVHLDVGGGGSGRPFDWAALAGLDLRDVFVAGGITPDNVSGLLAYSPWGIDVSSGVESSPGIKDHRRLAALFTAVTEGEDVS